MVKKALVTAVLALAAVVGMPMAANAAYVPAVNITVVGTPTPGGTSTVDFLDGSFTPGETVSFSVTGSGSATLSTFRANTVTTTKQATASGAASVKVGLPTDATSTYTVTATGLTSGNIGTASLTVVPASSGSGTSSAGSGTGLAATGSDLPMVLIWSAGGVALLGLVLFVVIGVARRRRA